MEALKSDIIEVYTNGGFYQPTVWKEDSDKLFGPSQAVAVWTNLKDKGFIPDDTKNIVFVSPNANLPTHEVAIWQTDQETRKGKSLFLASDMLNIQTTGTDQFLRKVCSYQSPQSRFQYFLGDVERLPIQAGKVDVLWDRKGLLWHLAFRCITNMDAYEANKLRFRLQMTFGIYGLLLRPKGCLVIDSIDGFKDYLQGLNDEEGLREVTDHRPSIMFPNAPGQYEPSTVDHITDAYPQIWDRLSTVYDIEDIGLGTLKTRVLRKR